MSYRIRDLPSKATSADVLARLRGEFPVLGFKRPNIYIRMVKSCSKEGCQDAIVLWEDAPKELSPHGLPIGIAYNMAWGTGKYPCGVSIGGFHGLTQLYNTQGKIDADVVAVTGLTTIDNAYEVWSRKVGNEKIMWLRDFLKQDLPTCRTMLFGYHLQTTDNGELTLLEYVSFLLQRLHKARTQPAERQRPLVLMGHGIGCVAVVAALLMAKRDTFGFSAIFQKIRGIILFDPPYSYPHLDTILPPAWSYRSRRELEISLGVQSPTLDYLVKDFALESGNLKIVSFHQAMVTRPFTDQLGAVIQPVPLIVLPTAIEAVHIVEADHSEMVRFKDRRNDIYKSVIGHIKNYIYDITTRSTTAINLDVNAGVKVGTVQEDYLWWKYLAEFGQATVTTREDQRGRSETWENAKMIGEGAFGEVYMQNRLSASGESTRLQTNPTVRAVKSIPRAIHRNDRKTINRELSMMIAVRQYTSNFVEFYGWYEDEANTIYIAMEYIAGGDLYAYMRQNRARAKRGSRVISSQILTALEILHTHEICHRDLKPQNVLIASMSPLRVKLADFGISKSTSSDTKGMSTRVGTPNYIAPEVLGLSGYRRGTIYTQAVDIWALGVLTHKLYTGKVPFTDDSNDDEEISGVVSSSTDSFPTDEVSLVQLVEYCKKVNGSAFPDTSLREAGASNSLFSFISSLLCPDPLKRPSASGALKHIWITEIETNGLPESYQSP